MALSDQSETLLAQQGFEKVKGDDLIKGFSAAAEQATLEKEGRPFALMQPFQIGDYRYADSGRLINHRNIIITACIMDGVFINVVTLVKPALDPRRTLLCKAEGLQKKLEESLRQSGYTGAEWVRPLPRHNFDYRLEMALPYSCGPAANHVVVYPIEPTMRHLALR